VGETVATLPCARCRAAVDTARAYYSEHGELLCGTCNAKADIAATEGRAIGYIQWAAFGNLGVGLFALLIFNPMLIFSGLAVLNAIFVTTSLVRDTWYQERMGARYHAALICCISGGVLGGLPLVFVLLAIAFGMTVM
jgi:hypothetical protein